MIVHANEEQVVPLGISIRVEFVAIHAPGESVTMKVILGLSSRVRENFVVLFGPTKIGIVPRILIGAVFGKAVTIFVEVLPVTVPATNGSVRLFACLIVIVFPKNVRGRGKE